MTMKYGAFESHPCVYDDSEIYEGYVLFMRDEDWREIPIAEILHTVRPMTEAEFKKYGDLPPVPWGSR